MLGKKKTHSVCFYSLWNVGRSANISIRVTSMEERSSSTGNFIRAKESYPSVSIPFKGPSVNLQVRSFCRLVVKRKNLEWKAMEVTLSPAS